MKKIMLFAAIALSVAAFGAEATLHMENRALPTGCTRKYTPLSLNIITPVGLPWGSDWDVNGLQIGIGNCVENFGGWQIGIVNTTDVFSGLQLGLINVTRKMYGVQVGVVNVIQDNDIPFLPIINCYF